VCGFQEEQRAHEDRLKMWNEQSNRKEIGDEGIADVFGVDVMHDPRLGAQ
jgi:hypothetical protein